MSANFFMEVLILFFLGSWSMTPVWVDGLKDVSSTYRVGVPGLISGEGGRKGFYGAGINSIYTQKGSRRNFVGEQRYFEISYFMKGF